MYTALKKSLCSHRVERKFKLPIFFATFGSGHFRTSLTALDLSFKVKSTFGFFLQSNLARLQEGSGKSRVCHKKGGEGQGVNKHYSFSHFTWKTSLAGFLVVS